MGRKAVNARTWIWSGWLVAALSCSPAFSDTVLMKNGDQVSGKVVSISPESIQFVTEYAGTITIQRGHVRAIETDGELVLKTGDSEPTPGQLVITGDSQAIERGGVIEPAATEAVLRAAPTIEALETATKEAEKATRPDIWKGTLDSGLSIRRGERDTFDANAAFSAVRTVPTNTLTLKLTAAYGEADDTLNTQRAAASGKWQFYPLAERRFYYYVTSGVEHDLGRQLELRSSSGGGVGYLFIDEKRRKFSSDIGFEYAHERWENFKRGERRKLIDSTQQTGFDGLLVLVNSVGAGARPLDFAAVADSVRLADQIVDPDVLEKVRTENHVNVVGTTHYEQAIFKASKLINDLSMFPSLDELGNFRAVNEAVFTTPLSEQLSLRVSLRTEFDNDPGRDEISEWDNTLVTGIRYQF